MKFRPGQRVRLLHEEGEGVITRLIDKSHVEIDLGDDFPLDVHISEIIAIDLSESAYLGSKEDEKKTEVVSTTQVLGTSLLDLSLVASLGSEQKVAFWLVNPEPVQILYTCYTKFKHHYQGISAGKLESGSYILLLELSQEQLLKTKSFYFQLIGYSSGKGHPQSPDFYEVKWSKDQLKIASKHIHLLNKEGWIFSLREQQQLKDVHAIDESALENIRQTDEPVSRTDKEVDLHIEALVARPFEMAPSEMLESQISQVKKVLSDAVIHHYGSVVFIHGLGQGTLKAAVSEVLKSSPHVRAFGPADPSRYGNGATKVEFY